MPTWSSLEPVGVACMHAAAYDAQGQDDGVRLVLPPVLGFNYDVKLDQP
jgi:hypothetical protein